MLRVVLQTSILIILWEVTMDKYFTTLDYALIISGKDINDKKLKAILKRALLREHDVGAEANYIINLWKEDRLFD